MADQREFSVPRVINGFFTGVLIGGACLGLDFFLGLVLSDTHFLFVGSAMIAGLLIGIGFYCREAIAEQRIFARYVDCPRIGLIVCTMCGVAMGPGPFVLRP